MGNGVEVSREEELVARMSIEFPRAIRHIDASDLLMHVAESLGNQSSIHYQTGTMESIRPDYDAEGNPTRHVSDPGSRSLSGTIQHGYETGDGLRLASASFRLDRNMRTDVRMYDHLSFERVPGWDLNEYGPHNLRLMDDVRERIGDWFASR